MGQKQFGAADTGLNDHDSYADIVAGGEGKNKHPSDESEVETWKEKKFAGCHLMILIKD